MQNRNTGNVARAQQLRERRVAFMVEGRKQRRRLLQEGEISPCRDLKDVPGTIDWLKAIGSEGKER